MDGLPDQPLVDPKPLAVEPDTPRRPVQRWRLTIRRRADAPAISQRDWLAAWEAAVVDSGLPVVRGEGPAGRPKISVGAPLGQGMAAEGELLELPLVERWPVWRVREALQARLPEGHELVEVEDVWLGEPALPGRVVAADYAATLVDVDAAAVADGVAAILAADELPRDRPKGDRVVSYDLRPFIEDLAVASEADRMALHMRLRHDPERGIGRPDEVLAELGRRIGVDLAGSVVVRLGLVLAADSRTRAGSGRAESGRAPRGRSSS